MGSKKGFIHSKRKGTHSPSSCIITPLIQMRKGFIHIVEIVLIVIVMFLVIWQFSYIPKTKTEWSSTKLVFKGNDLLYSLNKKGINWLDSEEVETEFSNAFNRTNILYDLKLTNVIKPHIRVGCICSESQFRTIQNDILKPFTINGIQINFNVSRIDPSDQPENRISKLYDVIILRDYNISGYLQMSKYLEYDKGIVEIRDLNAGEINDWQIQKDFFGLEYNTSLHPGSQDIVFTDVASHPNSTYYNIYKYFYQSPTSAGEIIKKPFIFSNFLNSDEKVDITGSDERRIILRQKDSNSPALIVNSGMVKGFGRAAWLSEGPMSEEMKKLIRDVVVWAAGDTYRIISNEIISSHAVLSLYTLLKPKGIVAYWSFDEGSDSILRDSSGNLNHGRIKGTDWKWTEGKSGFALNFSGNGDYAEVEDSKTLNPASITVSAWIKANGFTGTAPPIVKKADGTAGYALEIGGTDNNQVLFYVYLDTMGWQSSAPSMGLETGKWYHVAGVYDGNNITVYVNGVPYSSAFSGDIVHSNNPLNIGRDPSNPTRFWNGTIDEIAIFNRALTSEEIKGLYNFPSQFMFQPAEVMLTLGYAY